jgi:hypothetical protein
MKNKETLEEAAYREIGIIKGVYNPHHKEQEAKGFVRGAKWQAERMYSEEDLREAFKAGGKMSWTDISQETQEPYYYDFNEWFEQFKKK